MGVYYTEGFAYRNVNYERILSLKEGIPTKLDGIGSLAGEV